MQSHRLKLPIGLDMFSIGVYSYQAAHPVYVKEELRQVITEAVEWN